MLIFIWEIRFPHDRQPVNSCPRLPSAFADCFQYMRYCCRSTWTGPLNACSVMLIFVGMYTAARFRIMDEGFVFHIYLGKLCNSLFSHQWGIIVGRLGSLILVVDRVFANGPGDRGSIPGRVIPKTLKWYLIPPSLALSNISYVSREKWSNPGKRVVPSPTLRCSSYWKGSLLVSLDYSRQLY